jgi:hypothetical protein
LILVLRHLRHSHPGHEGRRIPANGTFRATGQADFMISGTFGCYLALTARDHETRLNLALLSLSALPGAPRLESCFAGVICIATLFL